MQRPKLTVRPTENELERLYERAAMVGYNSLSAYLIDCGLSLEGVLPRERQTLESLKFHIRLLSSVIEQGGKRKGKKTVVSVPPELLTSIALRAEEALRLINKILSQTGLGEEP